MISKAGEEKKWHMANLKVMACSLAPLDASAGM